MCYDARQHHHRLLRQLDKPGNVLELLLLAGWTVLPVITAVFLPSGKSAVHRRPARGVRAAAYRGALGGPLRWPQVRGVGGIAKRSLAASEAVNDRFGAENGLTWR